MPRMQSRRTRKAKTIRRRRYGKKTYRRSSRSSSKRVVTVPRERTKQLGYVLPDRIFVKTAWTDTTIGLSGETVVYDGSLMTIAGGTFGRVRTYALNTFINPNGYPVDIPLIQAYAGMYNFWRIRACKIDISVVNYGIYPVYFGYLVAPSNYDTIAIGGSSPSTDASLTSATTYTHYIDVSLYPMNYFTTLAPAGSAKSMKRLTRYISFAKVEGKGLSYEADNAFEGVGYNDETVGSIAGPTSNIKFQAFTLKTSGSGSGTEFTAQNDVNFRFKVTWYAEFYGKSISNPLPTV